MARRCARERYIHFIAFGICKFERKVNVRQHRQAKLDLDEGGCLLTFAVIGAHSTFDISQVHWYC
jgi:hypothetical protein